MVSGNKNHNHGNLLTLPFVRLTLGFKDQWGGVLLSDSHKRVLTFILGLRGTFVSNFSFLTVRISDDLFNGLKASRAEP